jgi:hypothetical protein
MAAKFPYNRDTAVRRGAGFSLHANVKAAFARAIRREMKKLLFDGRERVPCCFCRRELPAGRGFHLPRPRGPLAVLLQ